MKNFFFNKSNNYETITLVENNMVISDNQKIADNFIEYFDIIIPKLGLAIPKDHRMSYLLQMVLHTLFLTSPSISEASWYTCNQKV